MNESFDKHFTSNAEYWHKLARKGFVNTDDIVKARNYYDKYSYAEQNEAVKRLNNALSEVLKRNPDNQGLQQFVASMTEASDEMIKDKVTSSFRDLDKVTDTDITLKAKKLGIPVEEFRNQFKLVKERIDTEKGRERRKKELDEMARQAEELAAQCADVKPERLPRHELALYLMNNKFAASSVLIALGLVVVFAILEFAFAL